ncbi:MAG: Bacterial SH3 domain protein [Chloroflexi bacterium ADurb.Bin325]|nr:MAG: Bacterial SH3 domain protein [Chloroflexi bacterium ADurb.Bin325]
MPVVVARTVIPPYTAIAAGMLEVTYLPRGAVAQPAYADPEEVVGRLARLELLPGVPLLRAYAVPAAELRHTADARAVVLGVTVDAARVPAELLLTGQRVDVWRGERLVGPGLRVVAIAGREDGRLVVALESGQELVPALLAASGRADTALTLAPLERVAVAATPTTAPTMTPTPTPTATPSPTPGVAVVKPGPAQGLNVRAGPGTEHPVLATLPAGSRLTPVGRDAEGRWVEVCCVAGGRAGWVLAELVELTGDQAGLPVR